MEERCRSLLLAVFLATRNSSSVGCLQIPWSVFEPGREGHVFTSSASVAGRYCPQNAVGQNWEIGVGATKDLRIDRLAIATDENDHAIRRRRHRPTKWRQVLRIKRIASAAAFGSAGMRGSFLF